jgi:hypothetical protein
MSSKIPTEGERIFASIFTGVYLFCMLGIIGIIVVLILVKLFKQPPTLGFLLVFAFLGLYPHAKKLVLESLCETRGMPAMQRLVKAIKNFHSS